MNKDKTNLPQKSREAALIVKKYAKKLGRSVSAHCLKRGISPAVLYNWRTRNAGYDSDLFLLLISQCERSHF